MCFSTAILHTLSMAGSFEPNTKNTFGAIKVTFKNKKVPQQVYLHQSQLITGRILIKYFPKFSIFLPLFSPVRLSEKTWRHKYTLYHYTLLFALRSLHE